ncbi:trypsin domain-containing protein [Ditylenchus destructor]|nr:trypsin domain-containing protein [Ditylenchus destructor]
MTSSVLSVVLWLCFIHVVCGNLFALADDSKCGVTFFEPPPGQDGHRIYHGKEVPLGKWPWMAAIVHRNDIPYTWHCSGTVISNEYILTAAHCVNETGFDKNFQVVVGKLDVTTEKSKRLEIAAHVQHPEYFVDPESGQGLKKIENDIAIIKLAIPLEYSNTIQPICLPSSFEEDTSTKKEIAVIAGWGFKDNGRVFTDVLLEGTEYFRDLKECQNDGSSTVIMGGDSGGPIFVKSGLTDDQGRPRWMEVGVTSFGNGPGGAEDGYTRVSSYCDFIKNATEGKVKCLS